MADGRELDKKKPAREAHPRFSRERFESSPEFARLEEGMKKLLAVPKEELDALVKEAKEKSPRRDNPRAPGRKITKRADDA